MEREALKLALEALEKCRDRFFPLDEHETDRDLLWVPVNSAVTKCEAALAQPAQEPFGWWVETHSTKSNRFFKNKLVAFEYWKTDPDGDWYIEEIYTALPQRKWVGLTEKEAKSFIGFYKMDIARLVEAKLKQKNNY